MTRRTFFRALAGVTVVATVAAVPAAPLPDMPLPPLSDNFCDPIVGTILRGTFTEYPYPRKSEFIREYERLLMLRREAVRRGDHKTALHAKDLMYRQYGKFAKAST